MPAKFDPKASLSETKYSSRGGCSGAQRSAGVTAEFLPQLLLTRCITLVHRIQELFAAGDQINVATFLLVATTKLSALATHNCSRAFGSSEMAKQKYKWL